MSTQGQQTPMPQKTHNLGFISAYCKDCGVYQGAAEFAQPCTTVYWHWFERGTCKFCGLVDTGAAIGLVGCPGPKAATVKASFKRHSMNPTTGHCFDCGVYVDTKTVLASCTGSPSPHPNPFVYSSNPFYPLPTAAMESDLEWGPIPEPPKKESKPRCTECELELSATLDAYYGTNPWEASKCAPCRDGRREKRK